jgi:LmbE family N-acetylglucosaminyl deacetylase
MSDPLRAPDRLGAFLRSADRGCLVLSPHLDDAVLSCGSLLGVLAGEYPVTVATVFTEAGPGPWTRAARSYLRSCGATDAGDLYAARRQEDRDVLVRLGAVPVHLGGVDALFRRREGVLAGGRGLAWLPPEVFHRYPTYRFDIARGRVARRDRSLIPRLADEVDRLIVRLQPAFVFCPLAVGRHVDHVLTRMLGERHPDRAVYYSDFPYDRTCPPDEEFIAEHDLVPWVCGLDAATKRDLIRGYRTQCGALFPDGKIPVAPETYYLRR